MTDKQIIGGRGSAKSYTTLNTIEVMLENEKLKEALKAKEQECETLASQLDFEVQKKECLEQECERLKLDEVTLYWHKRIFQVKRSERKLKQTLTEIKEIIKFNKANRLSGGADISIEQILQKISECEVEDDNN